MQHLRILATASLFLACSPKGADTDGGSSSGVMTDGAEATSATGGDSLTGGAPTTGVDPTNAQTATTTPGDPTVTSTSTSTGTSGTTTTTATGGETDTGGDDLPASCAAVCAHWDACSPGSVGRVDECTQMCIADISGRPVCDAAIAAQWGCVAGLSCEEALKFIDGEPTSCIAEVDAAEEACGGAEPCNGEIGGGEETCEFERECGGPKQRIVCDTETCTCSEDGVPGKECPADGLCSLEGPAHYDAIEACCGFMWQP